MIPKADIVAWRRFAPWVNNAQVEQDLIISRALVAIFQSPFLAEQLAFRGGTALHKLYFDISRRYSEDIDLVQIIPAPIGQINEYDWQPTTRVNRRLDPFSDPFFQCEPSNIS